MSKLLYADLSYQIINSTLNVYKQLGSGLSVYFYKDALSIDYKK